VALSCFQKTSGARQMKLFRKINQMDHKGAER
jgi:hypothetical protein